MFISRGLSELCPGIGADGVKVHPQRGAVFSEEGDTALVQADQVRMEFGETCIIPFNIIILRIINQTANSRARLDLGAASS